MFNIYYFKGEKGHVMSLTWDDVFSDSFYQNSLEEENWKGKTMVKFSRKNLRVFS